MSSWIDSLFKSCKEEDLPNELELWINPSDSRYHVRMIVTSTDLFSERATDYAQFRPGYPDELFSNLKGVDGSAIAADVGAGTGMFSRGLLHVGYTVFAVEPNEAMRAEASVALGNNPAFHLVAGQGEATDLPDASVDLITVAQAFHWLDRNKARVEFARIGKPDVRIAVAWNSRKFEASAFMRDYKAMLLKFCPAYTSMKSTYWSDLHKDVREFFSAETVTPTTFPNTQFVNHEHMIGNLLSLSYAPKKGDPNHSGLLERANSLFREYEQDGLVPFGLESHLYCGRLS